MIDYLLCLFVSFIQPFTPSYARPLLYGDGGNEEGDEDEPEEIEMESNLIMNEDYAVCVCLF